MAGKQHHLSLNKINTIMKSSSDVDTVSKESSAVMSKATEMFLRSLTQEGYARSNSMGARKLDYKHLADVVHSESRYDFLRDIMPKKITVLEYKKIMARKKAQEEGEDEENTSSSSEDDDDSSSEDSENQKSSSE